MIIGYGYKGFEIAVDKFEKKYIKEIKRIVSETAEKMASQMKALAPVDGSNLKDSIDITYAKNGLTAIVKVGAFYGIYVEHGTGIYAVKGDGRKDPWVYFKGGRYYFTRGMHPQPFFYPSLEAASSFFAKEMNKLG